MSHATEIVGTLFFAIAILHTFSVKMFQHWAAQFPDGSVLENLFHLFGEVEIVFGFWATLFLIFVGLNQSSQTSIQYLESLNFTEPTFVFVVMAISSTTPILQAATTLIRWISKLLPLKKSIAFYVTCLVVGPLLGSFITEPAAMTVTALILLEAFYKKKISISLKYATLGLLFVNVSIGGTLTHFAAPPVLMVASKWNWDLAHMLLNFGWKAAVSAALSTSLIAFRFRKELAAIDDLTESKSLSHSPAWVILIHILFLACVVVFSHHMVVFVGLFLLFLGLVTVTKEYQSELKLRESLLVAFFLGGLVILGGLQRWWLEPLLSQLNEITLYLSAITLTSITDNAAITFLGAQVPTLSEVSKYALVAGSVVGGGLTVIANAPNPAGYSILNSSFGIEGISAKNLFLNALVPTLIAGLAFWIL